MGLAGCAGVDDRQRIQQHEIVCGNVSADAADLLHAPTVGLGNMGEHLIADRDTVLPVDIFEVIDVRTGKDIVSGIVAVDHLTRLFEKCPFIVDTRKATAIFIRSHAPHSSACIGIVYKNFSVSAILFSFTARKVPIHRISHRPRRRKGCRPQSLRPHRREKCRARATARPRPAADAPARTSATRCR